MRFGILGGMGPAATILLQQRILSSMNATTDDDHIPLLIDMNTQVPSRIDYLIHHQGHNPGPVLARMAAGLEKGGVDAIAMPCCTAHHFAADIENAVSIPFLNMVRLAVQDVATRVGIRCDIGLLASPATQTVGLFETALAPHGLSACYPRDSAAILNAIEGIKSSGIYHRGVDAAQAACAELEAAGVEAILIGCSEFSLVKSQLQADVPIVDAIDVLVASITRLFQCYHNKANPIRQIVM